MEYCVLCVVRKCVFGKCGSVLCVCSVLCMCVSMQVVRFVLEVHRSVVLVCVCVRVCVLCVCVLCIV